MADRTQPDKATRDAERVDAETRAHADRQASPDEAKMAEKYADTLDEDVEKSYEEMAKRGANQKGEGRIP